MPRPACPQGAWGALALALGSLAGPHASVPLSVLWVSPPVAHALACTAGARARPVPVPMPLAAPAVAHRPLLRSMRPVAGCLGALPAPLRALSVPWPLPGSLPCVGSSAARARSPSLLLAPSWIMRRASRCLCSRGSVTPGGERSGAGGRMCRVRPGGKGFGGNGLGGLVWVWVGLVWGRYFAPLLPDAAAAAAAGEAPVARAGSVPRFCGVLGDAAWPAERDGAARRGRGRNPSRTLPAPLCS